MPSLPLEMARSAKWTFLALSAIPSARAMGSSTETAPLSRWRRRRGSRSWSRIARTPCLPHRTASAATSDGGSGMAKALGVRFLNASGEDVAPGLVGLRDLARIDLAALDPRLADTEIVAITDVTNPLTGPSGAVAIYGPQKGIDVRDVGGADSWMRSYARMLEAVCGRDIDAVPGARH